MSWWRRLSTKRNSYDALDEEAQTAILNQDRTLASARVKDLVGGGAGSAPSDATYLTTTANAGLSAEVVVGATPGGELGGTWASPTVDATHSGSAHHTQSHNHSAAGDGTTLTPATLNLPAAAAPAQTADGQVVWDSDDNLLTVGDGAARQTFLPVIDATSQPLIDGDVAADGTEASVARKDHVHPKHHAAVTLAAGGEHTIAGQEITAIAATAAQAGHATAAQITKLDGIEALADVTDATNVAAAGAVMETDFNAKGDLLSASADNTPLILTVGANDTVLTADDTTATGLKWAAPAGGGAHAMDSATHTVGTLGDIPYGGAGGDWALLAGDVTGTKKFLSQTGVPPVSAAPAWGTIADADVPATHSGSAHSAYVAKATYDAQSVLAATADDTPAAVTMAEQTVLGRLTGGNIDDIVIGIADNNIVQIDHAPYADDNDYAKFTANGLEGRSYAEVKADLDLEDADINTLAVAAVAAADDYIKNDASDSTTGTLTAAGFTTDGKVHIDSSPANDTVSGMTATFVAGEAIAYGDMCYIDSAGEMKLCDADAEATSRCVACCADLAGVAHEASGTFLLHGFIEHEFDFGTIGEKVFLDTATAGGVTLTSPSAVNDCVVIVGISAGADLLYFSPTVQAIVEHTG